MEAETITKQASSFDILPTISNLMGLEYDSRLLIGNDIFSDHPPLIPFLNKSFITDKGEYNSVTDTFTAYEDDITEEELDYLINTVQAQFYYSRKILENDYYRTIFED